MTNKQLRTLISAGVFSAALLQGIVYAGETASDPPATDSTTVKTDVKQSSSTAKGFFQHGCAGANGCGGK